MEEYDHCEVHFFPRDPRLGLSEENVRRVVPLPSSVAFDQQMLRMAEEVKRLSEKVETISRAVSGSGDPPGRR